MNDDEIKESKQTEIKSIVMCGHVLVNVGVHPFPFPFAEELLLPTKDNSFRGGSIGKGGKIKYRRG